MQHFVLPDDGATLAVYRALEHRRDGVVAELPIVDPKQESEWAYVEAPRMLYGTLDLHPRVNGYSGDWPGDYRGRVATLRSFPDAASLALARRLHVRYVILHIGRFSGFPQYTERGARRVIAALPAGATAHRYGDSWLVVLPNA